MPPMTMSVSERTEWRHPAPGPDRSQGTRFELWDHWLLGRRSGPLRLCASASPPSCVLRLLFPTDHWGPPDLA